MKKLASNAPLPLIPRCAACRLFKKCENPKLPVMGSGSLPLMFVTDSPSALDDERGKWLCGGGGGRVKQALEAEGVRLSDCTVTGALICHPKNRKPDTELLRNCLPNFVKAIKEHKPSVVVLLGQEAVSSVIGYAWKSPAERLDRWVGLKIPSQKPNVWLCPTWNPSYLERGRREDPWLANSFTRHIQEAVKLAKEGGLPHEALPNYAAQVERVFDPDHAAHIIRQMVSRGGLTAFDYETDRLKPDHSKSRIVTCAICWRGKRTIAYPMVGEAIEATREYLVSDLPKIACNMKFEERWSMRHFKTRVRNWVWCTLLGAHYLDNRTEITSIKFQSFAMLGEQRYNSNVDDTLKATRGGANSSNRITQGDLSSLLLYNGLDALLEYHVGVKQMEGQGLSWDKD